MLVDLERHDLGAFDVAQEIFPVLVLLKMMMFLFLALLEHV